MLRNQRLALMAGIAMVAMAACGPKSDATTDSTSAMTDSATNANMMAPAPLTDANIVYILDEASNADSARGALAATKGTSADVKEFGKLMMGEHHSLRQMGQELATKLGVTPMAPANDMSIAEAQTQLDRMNADAKGTTWDKAYIDYEVTYHRAVIETATKALNATPTQELKDLISQAAPILQKHLDRALEIQSKLPM